MVNVSSPNFDAEQGVSDADQRTLHTCLGTLCMAGPGMTALDYPTPGLFPLHLGVSGDLGDRGPWTLACCYARGRSGPWLPTASGCAIHKLSKTPPLASHTPGPCSPPSSLCSPHLTSLWGASRPQRQATVRWPCSALLHRQQLMLCSEGGGGGHRRGAAWCTGRRCVGTRP